MYDPAGPIRGVRGSGEVVVVGLGLLAVRVGDGGGDCGRAVDGEREVVGEGAGLGELEVVEGLGVAGLEGWAA